MVSNFRRLYTSSLHAPGHDFSLPAPTDDRQQIFHAGIWSLTRAHQHQSAKIYNKVMFNIEVLVFSLWWFGSVRHCHCQLIHSGNLTVIVVQGFLDFPTHQASLFEVLSR